MSEITLMSELFFFFQRVNKVTMSRVKFYPNTHLTHKTAFPFETMTFIFFIYFCKFQQIPRSVAISLDPKVQDSVKSN